MKRLLAAVFALALTAVFTTESAEAARLGGGRSMGVQRAAPMQRQATPPAPSQQAKPAAPATQPAQPAGNRWFGPLAGLAAGLGLGWLLGQGGLGGMLGGLLLAVLAGVAVMMLVNMFARRRAAPAVQMQKAAWGAALAVPPPSQPASAPVAGGPVQSLSEPQIPAGFDAETFLKHAKLNFLQLQEANDRADLNQLREVTTPEMFDEFKGDVVARGARQQQTEVIALNAALLEVATEGGMHWASVRFSGSVRESPRDAPEAFDEVWNLRKPVNGETGWLLAGIQQPA